MKKIHINTIVSVIFSCISLALTFYQVKFQPEFYFDLRIVSAILGIAAWFAAGSEFQKYTSWFQIAALYLGTVSTGLAADNFFNTPLLTLSLLLGNTAILFRIIFKEYFSEEEHKWIEPVLFLLTVGLYLSGNIFLQNGWLGWIFPAPLLILFAKMLFEDAMFHKIQFGFAKKKIGVESGTPAPHFSLPDQEGNTVSLTDFTGKRHLLVIFVRGDWCPSCHMKMRTYQKHSAQFQEKNVVLLAIGPDPIGVNKEMASKLGVEYKVLSDEGQKVAMAYSVQLPSSVVGEKYNPGIPLPASFLIDKNGVVRYSSRPEKVGEFLNPSAIFPILESLN